MDTVLRDNWPWTGLLGLDGYVPTPTVHKPTPHGPSLAPRTGAVPFFETRAWTRNHSIGRKREQIDADQCVRGADQ